MDDQRDSFSVQTPRRIEIFTGASGRRRWSDAVKAQIVAESFAPGAVVTDVARRHGAKASQVHAWRKDAREGRLVLPADNGAMFAQVVLAPPSAPKSKPPAKTAHSVLDIEAATLVVRVRAGADVALVEAVLRALKAGA